MKKKKMTAVAMVMDLLITMCGSMKDAMAAAEEGGRNNRTWKKAYELVNID